MVLGAVYDFDLIIQHNLGLSVKFFLMCSMNLFTQKAMVILIKPGQVNPFVLSYNGDN